MTLRRAVATPLLAVALLTGAALAGCAAEPEPAPVETEEPAADPAPEDTSGASEPPAAPVGYQQPETCDELLPQSRLDSFSGQGLDLLGGPGGRYGNDYLIDETPEEQAGGITCIWGDEEVPESTITVSAAPLDAATRPGVISDLLAQGLTETPRDDATTFAQLGDEISSPAVLNVLRDDSWISVIEALGGEAFFEEATVIAAEVAAEVYG